jgi:histidine triad (HIT) family protein
MADDCLFCRMASGTTPTSKVHEDDKVFVIKDIHPRAPTHVMIIPKQHIGSARELGAEHGELLAHMFATATTIADNLGVSGKGYRLTFNVGDEGGQTIYHLHLHLLGGRRLGPEG